MFDRLKRSISRSRHQSAVNELLSKLSKALAPRDLSKEVDITSNSHLQSFVESLNDRALAAKIESWVKELQALNLDRKRIYAELLERYHTKDAPPQNARKLLEAYLVQTEQEMKELEEYFGQAGSGGFEQIEVMENRVELIKDIIHLLPANYEYTGPKHTKSAFSAPATPIGRVEEQRPKTPAIAVPPMPVSGGSGMLGEVVQTSPVVASYVN